MYFLTLTLYCGDPHFLLSAGRRIMAGIVRHVPTPGTVAQLPGAAWVSKMTNCASGVGWEKKKKQEEEENSFYWAQTHDTRARARWG